MTLELTDDAIFDLEEISAYIAKDNPTRAVTFVDELEAFCDDLCLMPRSFPSFPQIGQGARRAVFGNYCIYYTVTDERVVVFAIIEGHRHQGRALAGRKSEAE